MPGGTPAIVPTVTLGFVPASDRALRPFWMHQIVEYIIGIAMISVAIQNGRSARSEAATRVRVPPGEPVVLAHRDAWTLCAESAKSPDRSTRSGLLKAASAPCGR